MEEDDFDGLAEFEKDPAGLWKGANANTKEHEIFCLLTEHACDSNFDCRKCSVSVNPFLVANYMKDDQDIELMHLLHEGLDNGSFIMLKDGSVRRK
jgi:hypothetical protein